MNEQQTSVNHPLVLAYLQQLESALFALPADERAIIVDDVTEHIADSLRDGQVPPDSAHVRAVLDSLGDPVAIATEAGTAPMPTRVGQRAPFLERRSGAVVIVLLLLIGGIVLPVLGWLVGVVLLWASRGWSTLQKLVGTLVFPGGLFSIIIVAGALPMWFGRSVTGSECTGAIDAAEECVELGPLIQAPEWSWLLLVIMLALQAASSAYLLAKFRSTETGNNLPHTT
ncbi:MAG: hypothetical protein Q4P15_00515 [Propionibacteriaceae bacterium]|nr:hypothetical protein [Propionibacteriaceae bacterium]